MKHLHEEILEVANRIASSRKEGTFGVDEIVRALPHLNENSVRTHVVSRCCENAPKNHLHKWNYFHRVSRGKYRVLPPYRQTGSRAVSPDGAKAKTGRSVSGVDETGSAVPRSRRDTIHAVVQKDATTYVAECLELSVVTQGSTLDEVTNNLRDAVALHLDDEDMATLGFVERPRIQVMYNVPVAE